MKRVLFAAHAFAGNNNQLIVLAKEMVLRGYSVSYATGTKFRDSVTNSGAEFIDWDPESHISNNNLLRLYREMCPKISVEPNIHKQSKIVFEFFAETYLPMYRPMNLIIDKIRPDLIVADAYAFPAIDIAIKNNIPPVAVAFSLEHHAPPGRGQPHYPSPFRRKMGTFEKITNFFFPILASMSLRHQFKKLESYRQQVGNSISLGDVFNRCLILSPTFFGFEMARPIPSNVAMVGPILSDKTTPLSEPLAFWMDEAKSREGVLYVSFGTLVTLEPWQIDTLITGLKRLKINILWSMADHQPAFDPSIFPPSFRHEKYVSQRAVLEHPAMRLFLSHCGVNSVHESLWAGIPLLALPIANDGYYNASRVEDAGVGLQLDKRSFTADEVEKKANQLLFDPRYALTAKKLSIIQHFCHGRERTADLLECISKVGIEHYLPN